MAASFTILSTQQVTEFLPPNKSRIVHEVTAMADPSGVVFYLRFVPSAFKPAIVARDVGAVASGLNADANVPGVVGIQIEQDIGSDGQVVEYGVATVESTSGDSTMDIRDKQGWLFLLDSFRSRVANARATLDEIEAL